MWANSVNSLVFFPSLIQNLKCTSWSQSMWNEDGGGRHFSYSSSSPGVPQLQPGTEMRSVLLIRQQVSTRLRRLRCDFKKVAECSGTYWRKAPALPWSVQVQAGVEQPEEEWQQSASSWHAPSSGRPWQESHQLRRVEFPNFVVPSMLLFSFLPQSSVDCPVQNNTTFREDGEFSLLPGSINSLVRKSISTADVEWSVRVDTLSSSASLPFVSTLLTFPKPHPVLSSRSAFRINHNHDVMMWGQVKGCWMIRKHFFK